MSSTTTVAQFAAELNKSTATLIEQLASAGVPKASADEALSEADKQKLLGFLQDSHGTATTERKKITLVKKSTSEIKQADATGKARTIQVEVRKKRTFVKREDGADAPVDEPVAVQSLIPQNSAVDEADLARREDEANRHAELLRRQEADLTEKRRLHEEREAKQEEQERLEAEKMADAVARAAQVFEKAKPGTKKAKEAALAADVAPTAPELTAEQTAAAAAIAAAKAKATAEFQADAAKSLELQDRRKKAEAEAANIRAMMNAPKRVLVPHVDPKEL